MRHYIQFLALLNSEVVPKMPFVYELIRVIKKNLHQLCDALNSAHDVKRGCHFFPIYYKLINFKLVHSYNVKHLTCNIFYSSGLQNIYKFHIWKCSTFIIFTLFTKETKIHIH